ncbi:MAG: ATP-binding protein [Lachnospiraceae bacterium]|nr:ATP-binding protein [Clostridium sp.]MDD6178604.1 ATP-binding protein [Clostridium sp.]MDY4821151.1 ATP-binding protein [Lachnospiraceae bacterium]
MTKKIFHSILLVACTVLLACYLVILTSLNDYFTSLRKSQLKTQLSFASTAVEDEGIEYLKNLENGEYRLTLIDTDGTVLYDTNADAATMENHSDRREFQEAFLSGYGESHRYSRTLTEQTYYFAKKLSDDRVLRISTSQVTIVSLLLGMLQPLLVITFLAILLSVFLAKRASRNLVKPLNNLDLNDPLSNDVYEELSPLLRHMAQQNKQIALQMDELSRSQNEFNAITSNMSEGLIVLNKDGVVVSLNTAARKIFEAEEDSIGKDFLTIDRTPEISRAIKETLSGKKQELEYEKNGRNYDLCINQIVEKDEVIGVLLLAIDNTEKIQAEQNRREFTANVSHELKTPLQSIIGSADLIESGLVKPEDMPRFIGHIKTDAARLVSLVSDIIRLSQLDENTEMNWENVDALSVAKEALEMVGPIAESRNISLTIKGEPAPLTSVHKLLYDIIYNLCDNAVKYNKEGGFVKVDVKTAGDKVQVAVSDNGVGIAPADQSRVFERFYRVDKSHSRESGGTGLGLSIVKHAVAYLKGSISLESTLGKGTTITVSFPAEK